MRLVPTLLVLLIALVAGVLLVTDPLWEGPTLFAWAAGRGLHAGDLLIVAAAAVLMRQVVRRSGRR